jgi:glucose/arabinose dehydrogenase/PKD repeat protein
LLSCLKAEATRWFHASVLLILLGFCLSTAPSAGALTLPPGFREDVVFSGLTQPVSVAFSPDGRVFVAEKRGLIKVYTSLADTSPDVVADLRTQVHDFWDRGLLGMALHPNFPSTNAMYVLYTYDAPPGGTAPVFNDNCADATGQGCVVTGRLSRLTNIGGATSAVSEQVLIHDWCQQYPSHSVGSLLFGPDGALYVSGGDGASFTFADYGQRGNPCGDPPGGVMSPPFAEGGALRSQDLRTPGDPATLDGAILRVDPTTGAGLPDNPLGSSSDPNARRIIAQGLRNPFRMSIRPGTSELWVGDVGWGTWEEINRIADVRGSVENFGWPCYEGDRNGSARQPVYDGENLAVCENLYAQANAVLPPYVSYKHREPVIQNEACPLGGSSITGLAFQFYTGGPFPPEYDGALFFADYSRNCIWVMQRSGSELPSPSNIKSFVGGAAAPVELRMSPGGELFYADITGGTVRRVSYVAPPPSGEDKALGRPATASSIYGPGFEAGRAVDGNGTTRWSSAFADSQWWQVDLGSARQVNSVRVNWETAYASRYNITTSTDGTTWSPAASVSIGQAGAEVTSFTTRAARYVRVTAVTRATAWGVSFWDVNVYGPADTANNPPTALASASPLSGAAPLGVSFNGSASSDPDGDPLTYAWDLDGNGTFTDATTANPTWTYQSAGVYDAVLRVSDGKGGTDTATVTIRVGAPVPTIETPSSALRWAVGDRISFSGSAVDSSGQPIPASGLTWTLVLHHGSCPDCHEHVLSTDAGVASGTFTAPDHDYPSELELRLTATDASGLSGSTSVRLMPRTVNLTLATVPSGLQVGLNSTVATTPLTQTVIAGSANAVSAPSPQTLNGTWTFASWSDGGTASHTVTAPATDTTLTATYQSSSGLVDKALNRPATASTIFGTGFEAGKAVDGNSSTRWSSGVGDNQWWQVDLGSVRQVDTVVVNWEAAYASEYRISTSTDGVSFTDAATVTIGAPGTRTTTFAARGARYVRITGVRRATVWGISFWDLNVYGPADTAPPPPPPQEDKALNRVTAASSTGQVGQEPAKAVDGDPATRWSSAAADGEWWQVDLGSIRKVDTVRVTWHADYAARYRISVATQSGSFAKVVDVRATAPGARTTSFAVRDARWIRITSLSRASAAGISFFDFNAFGPPDG